MKIENPAALRFIIDDDLYLLASDKIAPQDVPVSIKPPAPQPIVQPEPQFVVAQPEPEIKRVTAQPEPETPAIDFKYKGGNKKQFLILVNYAAVEFIEDAHLAALENILKRKELSLDDVAILNLAKYPDQDKKELFDFFKPERLLIMGKEAIPTNFAVSPLNQIAQVDNIKTLYSFSFGDMMNNNDNKKIFWDQMKNL